MFKPGDLIEINYTEESLLSYDIYNKHLAIIETINDDKTKCSVKILTENGIESIAWLPLRYMIFITANADVIARFWDRLIKIF